jgi:hypothetical protein
MSRTCPQCHANLGAMVATDGYFCSSCESVFVEDPDDWQIYDTDYKHFDRL